MTAFGLIALWVVGGLLLLSMRGTSGNSRATEELGYKRSDSDRLSNIFLAVSPLPMVLTLLVPVAINLVKGFKGAGMFVYEISMIGCWVSLALLVAGTCVTVWASMTKSRMVPTLVLSTLLAGLPAIMLLFIYLYGFGGVLNH